MIICPNCRHEEIDGAIFCNECGALLEGLAGLTTQNIPPVPTNQLNESAEVIGSGQAPPPLEAEFTLCVVDTGQMFPLDERDEFTLGRSAEGQPILPDIDLAPFRAYENGVSRLHASIKKQGRQLTITDLGSINGTRLNGQKISPHKPCPLNHGDILTLGKLKIQILFRR
jgi:hypothetical protein